MQTITIHVLFILLINLTVIWLLFFFTIYEHLVQLHAISAKMHCVDKASG